MPTLPSLTDDEKDELFEESWPKTCSCGQVYTEDDWEKLEYVGIQKSAPMLEIPDLEMRACRQCESTMAIVVPTDFV